MLPLVDSMVRGAFQLDLKRASGWQRRSWVLATLLSVEQLPSPALFSRGSQLISPAIRRHTKLAVIDIPDTGTLRGDILALLRHMSARVGEIVGVFSLLIADYFSETGMSGAALRDRALAGEPSAWQIVLDRAVVRGEINPELLSPRVASLPLDLVRHDVIMNRRAVPDETLVEIVDRIFLPLVLAPPKTDVTY